MKMQCEIINPTIYECVSDNMKGHADCFWAFYGNFANEAR